MNAETLREMLHQRPFVPFEIIMSSGEFHLVPHPECLLVLKSKIAVGDEITDRLNVLALSHITELRPVESQPSA